MARVLISGGSGLIGRRVVEAYRVDDGLDQLSPITRADVDLLDADGWRRVLDEHRPDVVIHLAWSASAQPGYREHDDNARWVDATVRAAELSADRGIFFVGTGTAVDDVPAEDAYSRSKWAARNALAAQIAAGGLTWLRPFYVFDEERPSPAVLSAALSAKAAGNAVALARPTSRHDFVHARDAGTAIKAVVDGRITGTVDIGSGATASVSELVESYGCTWVSSGTASAAAATDAVADMAAVRAMGWSPVVTDARLQRGSGDAPGDR